MRALITGGTGFVGSHLVRRLLREGVEVAMLMRPNSNAFRVADLLSEVDVIHGDMAAIDQSAAAITSFAPEVVFHLAWQGATSNRFQDDPSQVFDNLEGSLRLIRIASRGGCRRWIGLGSVLEYGQYEVPVVEHGNPQPVSLYAKTKHCVSLLANKLCEGYGISFVWLRLFWAYGPADSPLRLIPYVILALLRGEKPSLTPGDQVWDYLFVEDVAEAMWQTAVAADLSGAFNLGSGEANTIRDVTERIRDLISPGASLGFGEVPYGPTQIMHLQADISRLQTATGWRPSVWLDEGLQRTVEWFRRYRNQLS